MENIPRMIHGVKEAAGSRVEAANSSSRGARESRSMINWASRHDSSSTLLSPLLPRNFGNLGQEEARGPLAAAAATVSEVVFLQPSEKKNARGGYKRSLACLSSRTRRTRCFIASAALTRASGVRDVSSCVSRTPPDIRGRLIPRGIVE